MQKPTRNQLIDPICGMHMDPEESPAYVTYGDRTFYFCSDTHRDEFLRDPERYAALARREESGLE